MNEQGKDGRRQRRNERMNKGEGRNLVMSITGRKEGKKGREERKGRKEGKEGREEGRGRRLEER